MIIKMNLDGTIEKTYGSRVFKGSNAVQEIALFAPFSQNSTILVNMTLPDGTEYTDVMIYSDFNIDEQLNMWYMPIKHAVTQEVGKVSLSFEIRAITDELEVLSTAETHITIEKSNSNVIIDDVDRFFDLANEGIVRAQQALNENQVQDGRLDTLEQSSQQYGAAIQDLQANVTSLEDLTEKHDTDINTLKNTVATHDTDIAELLDLQSRVDTVEDVTDDHTNRIETVEGITDKSIQNIDLSQLNENGKIYFERQSGERILVDLPLEFLVKDGYVDEETGDLVLELENADPIRIPLEDIFAKIDQNYTELAGDIFTLYQNDDAFELRISALETDNVQNKEDISDHEIRIGTLETDNATNKQDIVDINTRLESTFTEEEKQKLADIPEPNSILTKINAIVDEAYLVDNQFSLTTRKWVLEQIQGATGVDLSGLVDIDTFEAFRQQVQAVFDDLNKPTVVDMELSEPITYIEDAILDAPNEIQAIHGNSLPIISDEDLEIAGYSLDGVTNEIYYENNQPYITIRVDYVDDVLTVLETPITRLAKTEGIADVVNPVVKSVGRNLFDGEYLEDTAISSAGGLTTNIGARTTNLIRVEPLKSYTLSGSERTTVRYLDKNKNEILVSPSSASNRTIQTPEGAYYLQWYFDKEGTKTNIMLNKGTTPLPYEPYQSHILSLNGTYRKWDKAENRNGVWWDVIATNTAVIENPTDNGDYITIDKPSDLVSAIMIDGVESYTINDTTIDLVTELTIDELAGKEYIYNVTPTERLSTVISKDDLDFSQYNTIYLESDTIALPKVDAKVAMDIAGQVKLLNTDSKSQSNLIQKVESDINTIRTKLDTVEENAQVNIIEQINDYEPVDKKVTIPNADANQDGLMSIDKFQQVDDNTEKIQALQGAYVIRGVITTGNNDVSQNILNNFILNEFGRSANLGDTLIDADNHEWYFNGTTWLDLGESIVSRANATTDGVLKIGYNSTDNNRALQLDANGRGYVTIPNASTGNHGLMSTSDKQTLNNHGNTLDNHAQAINGINQVIAGMEDDISQNAANISALQNSLNSALQRITTIETTLENAMPRKVTDVTLRISGFTNGQTTSMVMHSTRTFKLETNLPIAFANIKWTTGGNLDVISSQYDEIRLNAESTGSTTLKADVVDIYGNAGSILIVINVITI